VLGRDQDFSNRKARALLGWEPRVGYADGLGATLAWLAAPDTGIYSSVRSSIASTRSR
jgi:nucleoside-diphosphate-sugar epimerase